MVGGRPFELDDPLFDLETEDVHVASLCASHLIRRRAHGSDSSRMVQNRMLARASLLSEGTKLGNRRQTESILCREYETARMNLREQLARNLTAESEAYGYTLTIWGGGSILINQYGTPTISRIFFYIGGALAASANVSSRVERKLRYGRWSSICSAVRSQRCLSM